MGNRSWFAICCLPLAVAVVAAGLMLWNTPTREQLAIAKLVKTRANVMLFDAADGSTFLNVDLHGCKDNDEPLGYIPDIENVQSLNLNSSPVHESGVECLLRIKGLRYLNANGPDFPTVAFAQLECDLKRNNPNLEIESFRNWIPLDVDKK